MLVVRKAMLGDEKGIASIVKENIRRGEWNYAGTRSKINASWLKKWKQKLSSKKAGIVGYVAVDTAQNFIVGQAFFHYDLTSTNRLRHRVDFAWGVHPDYKRQGIATKLLKMALIEAKKMGFKKAEAEAAIENKASVNLAKKVGFRIEGKKKKGLILDNGKCVDTFVFGKIL